MELIKKYSKRNKLSFRTGFKPTEEQREFLDIKAKRKIAKVDRQWGKSRLTAEHALELLFRKKDSVIVVPYHSIKQYYVHMIENIFDSIPSTKYELIVTKDTIGYNGHTIKFLIGNENAIRGCATVLYEAKVIFIDEFQDMTYQCLQYIKHFAKNELILLGSTSNNLNDEVFNDFTTYRKDDLDERN